MILTAIVVFVWGCLFEYFHYYNKYAYLTLWALNGKKLRIIFLVGRALYYSFDVTR